MISEDVINLPGDNNPVMCSDGNIGILLIYPVSDGLCGVQVPGEEEHRWIPASDLNASEAGALRQKDAPKIPPASALNSITQHMLLIDWVSRGGPFISA